MLDRVSQSVRQGDIVPLLRAVSSSQLLSAGVTAAAIILLVGTGSNVVTRLFIPDFSWTAGQRIAEVLLLLNVALFLLGAHRYRELEREVKESRDAEAEARAFAERDPLTGLLNRHALYANSPARIAEWQARGRSIGALIVDLDSFKSINDLFGHAEGDSALSASAKRLAGALPDEALLARIGGDEFAVLLPLDPRVADALDRLGQLLVKAVGQPVVIAGNPLPISCSIGGAIANSGEVDTEALLNQADDAMYAAKGQGRNRYCAFTTQMAEALALRGSLESKLRRALILGELYPVYEPLVDLKSGRPHAFEMLARWHSPELGEVPPLTFIRVAEEAGLIGCLTEQLVERAMRDALQWPAHVSLSVNISPVQLRDPWLAQKLVKTLVETGFPAARLIVEITETALAENLDMARSTFASLRNQGVRIALDDFGTGYASLGQLRDLPFDTIKVDRDYVSKLLNGEDDGTMAQALLQLSQSLGLPVVAEGVETQDIADHLARLNCASAQGRLYGPSLIAADVLTLLTPAAPQARSAQG